MTAITHVRMGALALGEPPSILKATLGSCVGIAILWHQYRRAALAHCLLPDSSLLGPDERGRDGALGPARCVDQAVPAMIEALAVPRRKLPTLQAYLAGGACLRAEGQPALAHLRVGQLNVAAARLALGRAQVTVTREVVEGFEAMQIIVHCEEMRVEVVRVRPDGGGDSF